MVCKNNVFYDDKIHAERRRLSYMYCAFSQVNITAIKLKNIILFDMRYFTVGFEMFLSTIIF